MKASTLSDFVTLFLVLSKVSGAKVIPKHSCGVNEHLHFCHLRIRHKILTPRLIHCILFFVYADSLYFGVFVSVYLLTCYSVNEFVFCLVLCTFILYSKVSSNTHMCVEHAVKYI